MQDTRDRSKSAACRAESRLRVLHQKRSRFGGVAVFVAAAAIGLAACGGASSPSVANVGTGSSNGSRSTATTLPTSNPNQLLIEWAACMRSHGDPNQADPTITASKAIDITWNAAIDGGVYGTNKGGHGNSGPGQYCRTYLDTAQIELQGGQRRKLPSQAELVKFSECMRTNGLPDFPDPTSNGSLSFDVGDPNLNPNSPTFQHASKVCAQKTGVQGFGGGPQRGMIELNGAGP